jgi:hypothetical protein
MLNRGETEPTSAIWIMEQPTFAQGAADARARRGYPKAYEHWDYDDQWNYERGRQWAQLAPPSVKLKRKGKITFEAMRYYKPEIL